MGFRSKQIATMLFLIAAVAIGNAGRACACSHHDVPQAVEVPSCHSGDREPAGRTANIDPDSTCLGERCGCVAERSPYAATKAPSKEFKASDAPFATAEAAPGADAVERTFIQPPADLTHHDLSHLSDPLAHYCLCAPLRACKPELSSLT
jgi:hypothetical protein